MKKNTNISFIKDSCAVDDIIRKFQCEEKIIYVISADENYLGCITKNEIKQMKASGKLSINVHSFYLYKCDDEKRNARKIFGERTTIHNIPVINQEGKLLYEYVRDEDEVHFDSRIYWEQRYQSGDNSGSGSYNRLARFKAEVVNNFIVKKQINSMVEWGGGDGNQLSLLKNISYTGYDVSKTIIESCRLRFSEDNTKQFYWYCGEKLDFSNAKYDMSLSLDVIYHLTEDNIFINYMYNLFHSATKFVCIYSWDGILPENVYTNSHVKYRKFVEYIETTFPEWELIQHTKNKYPWKDSDPENTSRCEFYFWKHIDV